MKLPSQQTNKWLQALYATQCDAGHSSGTHAYVSIDFKACAHRPSMQKLCLIPVLISTGCRRGKEKERLITSAVASLCKLFPLNYSPPTYLSARSWSAVEAFKY